MSIAGHSLRLNALFLLCLLVAFTFESSHTCDQQTHAVTPPVTSTLTSSDLASPDVESMPRTSSSYTVELVSTHKSEFVFDATYRITNVSSESISPLDVGVLSAYQIDWLTASSADASGSRVSSVYGTKLQPGQSIEITKAWMIENPDAGVYLNWQDLERGVSYELG